MNDALQRALKKLLVVIIGSGLITNALYIYGIAYYEGYVKSLGFDYHLFPVKWEESMLWTYSASREIGASTVRIWTKFSLKDVLLFLAITYALARIWIAIDDIESKKSPKPSSILYLRLLVRLRRRIPLTFKCIYLPLRWLIIKEQSLLAFMASYFILIFFWFMPLLIFIWVYFPLIGSNHGSSVGTKNLEHYQSNLCSEKEKRWDQCITLSTAHLNDPNLPQNIRGRIVLMNGAFVGIITDGGPIIMTMPSQIFHKTSENKCYQNACDK